MPGHTIHVLIVDDDVVYRGLLLNIVEELPGAEVGGVARDGLAALHLLANHPNIDVILLDINMPGMDGIETLKQIMHRQPDASVVMISSLSDLSRDVIIKALDIGAMDFIQKPSGGDAGSNAESLSARLAVLFDIVRARCRGRRWTGRYSQAESKRTVSRVFEIVIMATSTGGPAALEAIVPRLSCSFPVPILIVQHMPQMFSGPLADALDKKSELHVREAQDHDEVRAGEVVLARGGQHLVLDALVSKKGRNVCKVHCSDAEPVNSCRPSADVLFHSVVKAGITPVLAVVMTGMGNDGADGLDELKAIGGYVLAQDKGTSTIYGMSRAVMERGLADEVLPLKEIAARITTLVEHGERTG